MLKEGFLLFDLRWRSMLKESFLLFDLRWRSMLKEGFLLFDLRPLRRAWWAMKIYQSSSSASTRIWRVLPLDFFNRT